MGAEWWLDRGYSLHFLDLQGATFDRGYMPLDGELAQWSCIRCRLLVAGAVAGVGVAAAGQLACQVDPYSYSSPQH